MILKLSSKQTKYIIKYSYSVKNFSSLQHSHAVPGGLVRDLLAGLHEMNKMNLILNYTDYE